VMQDLEGLSIGCQNTIVRRFLQFGTVDTWQGVGGTRPQQVMDTDADLWLLGEVLDDPNLTLQDLTARFQLLTGRTVHMCTMCRAMRRVGLGYGRLQVWASQRDDAKALLFYMELMSFYYLEDLLVLDETAKDRSDLRPSFGWGARGFPTIVRYQELRRDERVSALCCFSYRGFEDWHSITGTYTTALFDLYASCMVLQPRPWRPRPLIQRFPAVLIDNAKVHGGRFESLVQAQGGRVWRIPPYCATKLSALDNGGFGLVVRYMHIHARRLSAMPLADALNEAFRNAVPWVATGSGNARYCFRNCRYYSRDHPP
jgi:hypothetical protein